MSQFLKNQAAASQFRDAVDHRDSQIPRFVKVMHRWRIKRAVLKVNNRQLCKAGRLLQKALEFWAALSGREKAEHVADLVDKGLDLMGCDD